MVYILNHIYSMEVSLTAQIVYEMLKDVNYYHEICMKIIGKNQYYRICLIDLEAKQKRIYSKTRCIGVSSADDNIMRLKSNLETENYFRLYENHDVVIYIAGIIEPDVYEVIDKLRETHALT